MRSLSSTIARVLAAASLVVGAAGAGTAGRAASAPAALPPMRAMDNASYFFRAQDGSVLTLLTLELSAAPAGGPPGSADTGGAAFAGEVSVEEAGRHGEPLPGTTSRTVPLEVLPFPGDRERASFLGRVYLQPGRTYAVRYTVRDGRLDEILIRNDVVGVPDLSRGFSASSIVPAAEFGPAGPTDSRFQIGSEEVVPKAGGVFRRSELLRLYLQVYGAAIDDKTALARVDVEFRFYRTVKGRSKRHGKPFSVRGASGASMGLALPIGDWPEGLYRVEVELRDRVVEQRMTAEGRFSIAAD